MAPLKKNTPIRSSSILHYSFPLADHFRSDLLFLSDLEAARKKGETANPQLFFDTYAALDMLLGLKKIADGGFKKDLFLLPETLVYALSYQHWLGPIHLLPPHTEELIFKIKDSDNSLLNDKSATPFEAQEQEMWGALGLNTIQSAPPISSGAKKSAWLHALKAESSDLFKAFYLLQESSSWKARYKQLTTSNVLHFSQEQDYRLGDITKTPLFNDLLTAFNRARPRRSDNNYMDAVALCLLDQKLQAFEASDGQLPLPIFYCLQPNILDTVAAFSEKTYEKGHRPFTWKHENKAHLIVRNSDFFVLFGVMKALQDQNHGSYDRFFKVADDFLSGQIGRAHV